MPRKQNIIAEVENLAGRLENRARSARRAGTRRLKKAHDAIFELAQMYAPHYEGNLGEAIKQRTTRNPDGTNSYEVYVDEDMPGSNKAENVGKYAARIHDNLNYQLGKKSLEKDSDVGGNGFGWPRGGRVGPLFLTRAFKDSKSRTENEVRDAIKRELK